MATAAAAACLRRWVQGGFRLSQNLKQLEIGRGQATLAGPSLRQVAEEVLDGLCLVGPLLRTLSAKTGLPTPLDPRRQRMKLTRPRLCACLLVVAAKTPLGDSSGDQIKGKIMFLFPRGWCTQPRLSQIVRVENVGQGTASATEVPFILCLPSSLRFSSRICKPAANSQ
jgi:hypothetical protein